MCLDKSMSYTLCFKFAEKCSNKLGNEVPKHFAAACAWLRHFCAISRCAFGVGYRQRLISSLDEFSDDFMNDRQQPETQKLEDL